MHTASIFVIVLGRSDIATGDLAFGAPFGMIENGKDSVPVAVAHEAAIGSYGSEEECDTVHIPAVQILNRRGEFSVSMGSFPPHWRPYIRLLPWYRKGSTAVKNLAGLAVAAVAKRLTTPTDRVDLLSQLQAGRDDEGNPMGREELTAEALTQLIAGSDTTSKLVLCTGNTRKLIQLSPVLPVQYLITSLVTHTCRKSFKKSSMRR